MTGWALVVIAGLFEVGWAYCLKISDGFTRLIPTILTFVGAAISFVLLAQAMRTLPLGTAYTVWTGIGALGSVLIGIWLLGEPVTPQRIACITLIIAGIIGLKLDASS